MSNPFDPLEIMAVAWLSARHPRLIWGALPEDDRQMCLGEMRAIIGALDQAGYAFVPKIPPAEAEEAAEEQRKTCNTAGLLYWSMVESCRLKVPA